MSEHQCEHGYACARCVRQGKSWTAPRTEQGREEFRRHLEAEHRTAERARPSWRYRW
jgi:hypothetical protein